MAKITLTLNEQSSGQSVARYNLDTGGSALHIQAQNGVNYQFTDDATGLGPQGVTASKQGSDLVVTLDGSGPDLVIENYFSQGQGALIGVQADGSFTSYPVAAAPEHTLASEIVTEQALGSDQVPIAPLAVLGGVGLIAGGIALANGKDGKSYKEPAPAPDNNHPDSTPNSPEAPKVPDVTPKKPDNTPPYTPTPIPDPMPSPLPPSPNNPSPAPNPPGPSPSPSPSPSPNNPNQPKPGSAPIAADDKESASPGETVTIDVLKNDSDPDGVTNIDVNSVRLLDAAGRPVATLKVPGEGEWNVTFNGHVTFKPEAGFTGNPTPVQYTISDAEGHTSKPAKITLTYDPTQQLNTPGAVLLEGEAKIGGTLKAVVADNDGVQPGTVKYQWFAEGDAIPGATGESYAVTAADRGKHISVYVSYTDGKNHVETHNGTTGIIGDTVTPTPMPNPTPMPQSNPNPAPNPLNPSPQMPGHPGIPDPNLKAYQPVLYDDTVKAHRGGKVTINVVNNDTDAQRDIDPNTVQLLDKDGKGVTRLVVDKQGVWTVGRGGNVTFTPDKDFDKGNPDPVEYVLSDRNGNPSYNRAKITIEYPDAANNQEGKVELVGATKVGQTLIANVEDADGVQPENIKYQWFANGDAITGANGRSYTIQPIDRGKTLTVHVEYKDGAGHDEAFSSQPSAPVDAALTPTTPTPTPPPTTPNNPPSGNVTISGTAKVGEKLTASNDLQDADGMGSVKYRWFANGEEIGQGDSYTLKAADKGKTITVKAEYTDGRQHAESVESAKTAEVADSGTTPPPGAPNQPGSVAISGEAKVGGELTATVSDGDGVPNSVQYQWLRDGQPIDGATAQTYRLTAADAGHKITVQASYDDNAAHHESPTSAASDIGAQNNADQPTVSISGSDSVNEGGAATYTVSLDHASDQPVTVTLTLRHIETTDADFAPQPIEKTLTIPAGQTSATFSVNTADDRLPENNEHYRIEISAPQGAKLDAGKTGVTTQIIDNDESAANHNGTNTDTTFAGDRNADTPYFVKTLDSGYNGYGHLLGHKPGEGIKVTYAFNTSGKDTDGSTLAGFQAYSETQKAAIRTVLDHIAEHVNIKYTEGDNATLNFYKHTMDSERKVGYGVYGGGVHLSAERFSADDAFRSDIPYRIANGDAIEYYGWHSALHEVGHTLGLNHTFGNKGNTPNLDKVEDRDDLSVMSYTPGQTVPRLDVGNGNYYENYPIAQNKLGIYDLAALHHSFGVNPNYHSGDDTYGFKEFNKDAVGNDIYIHDGGGMDTFDAHEQTLDLNIDLTPGSWIYAGEKTAHLALNNDGTPTEHQMFIGYGTQIENAKGGTGNDTIKGNSAANYLFGFDGDDTIDGGAGNDQIEGGRGADTLTGGKGADHFIFASPLDGKADTITDFSFSEGDLLQLDHHIFTALESGTLAADQFVAGKEAKDANDHLLYDRATGELAYDPDGSGSAAAVTIAHLGANHDLDHNGIQII